jgi:TonB-dependent starch-binding outer membrane protein SusC
VDKDLVGDPETVGIRDGDAQNVFSQGQNWHGYPKARTFLLGLQIGL